MSWLPGVSSEMLMLAKEYSTKVWARISGRALRVHDFIILAIAFFQLVWPLLSLIPMARGHIWVQTPFENLPNACIDLSVWLPSAVRIFHFRGSPTEIGLIAKEIFMSRTICCACSASQPRWSSLRDLRLELRLLHCISPRHISSGSLQCEFHNSRQRIH